MAISGWRRLVFLSDYADSVIAEGKYAALKTDADKLALVKKNLCTGCCVAALVVR